MRACVLACVRRPGKSDFELVGEQGSRLFLRERRHLGAECDRWFSGQRQRRCRLLQASQPKVGLVAWMNAKLGSRHARRAPTRQCTLSSVVSHNRTFYLRCLGALVVVVVMMKGECGRSLAGLERRSRGRRCVQRMPSPFGGTFSCAAGLCYQDADAPAPLWDRLSLRET